MAARGGYHGRYLDIDLTSGVSAPGETDMDLADRFLGGKGLGLALLCRLDKSEDPLDPGNPMILLSGPLTGTSITTSNRSCMVTRSPLTGGFLDSHAGGHFGTALRRSGYDYIIIRGRSDSPVYLRITSESTEILDAGDLWGRGCFETEDILRSRHENSRVASIGPAGENLVRFACISTDKYRQFGRGGAGAVMGSKNLKAIVLEGRERVKLHDPGEFRALTKELARELMQHPNRRARYELGTPMWIRMGQEIGRFLPTRNFRYGQWDDYESLTSETMKDVLQWRSTGCYNCIIQCSKLAGYDGSDFEGPEYETTAYLGSNCLIADARVVARANRLCDDLGLDTISTGVTISFAMEAAERGILPEGNDWLRFGSGDALLRVIPMIAAREGVGDLLAEGTRDASKKLGQGAEYFAIQIGGMELSGVNPLGCYSMALSLATADFASHTRFWSATDEMNGNLELETLVPYVANGQDEVNVRNSMIVCDFLPFGLDCLARFLTAATGRDYDADKLMLIGSRISTLARYYNMRTGRSHADDVLPPRFYEEEGVAGLLEGRRISRDFFEGQLQEYYAFRGWDAEGRPTGETMEAQGLADFV